MSDESKRGQKRPRNEDNEGNVEKDFPTAGLPALRARAAFLDDWFANYGGDELYEIEVKLKDVTPQQFDFIKKRLDSFSGWASRTTTESTDLNHVSKVRGTVRAGQAPAYLLKRRLDNMDVDADGGQLLRFSLCTEESCSPPPSTDPIQIIRLKKRHSYNRKGEFVYDLTEVRAGESVDKARGAKVEYEVELEWCGQAGTEAFVEQFEKHQAKTAGAGAGAGAAHAGPGARSAQGPATAAAALADKFLMKAQDLVDMANQALTQGGAQAGAGRQDGTAQPDAKRHAGEAGKIGNGEK